MGGCVLLGRKIVQVRPPALRRCWPESLAQMAETLGGVAASVDTRYVDQRCESVVDRLEAQRPCLAPREEAGHEDPMSRE